MNVLSPVNLLPNVGYLISNQRRIFIFEALGYFKLGPFWKADVAVVTFSNSNSAPVLKFLNPDTGPKFFQI